jgi:hypothetical protein
MNPLRQSVCLYVYPSIVARQRILEKEYTRNNKGIVGHVVFYVVRILLKESKRQLFPKLLVMSDI